jgi:DNA polymerase III delta prime subunit
LLWYEKYRPTSLDDYVWTSEETRSLLEKWIADPVQYPHLLLAGSTGTGKTTIAKIIRSMVGADSRFIPASLRSGVETIRNEIVGFCESGGFDGVKLIILDEADRLSQEAQEMMRNVMDVYAEDVRFIFTCNRPEKIIDPLKGRMWVVTISELDQDQFTDRLLDIAVAEGVDMEQEPAQARLLAIVDQYHPNLRAAISELQRSADGALLGEPVDSVVSAEWETQLIEQFSTKTPIHTMRSLVASMKPDEQAYRILYSNSHLWKENEGEAVITIAEHLYRHSQAGLPDITLCACLIKLQELIPK